MDIEMARELVRAGFRASGELEKLLKVAKAKCSEAEYRDLGLGIAAAIDGIGTASVRKALAAHPELEAEIDEGIALRGRY